MSYWRRAIVAERCGTCGQEILIGAAYRCIEIRGLRKPKHRCAGCAGEPQPFIPADAPQDVKTAPIPQDSGFTRLANVRHGFTPELEEGD